MATVEQIATVRRGADLEASDSIYTDDLIGAMIDVQGVDATIAQVWTEKAAEYAKLVNVTEAGSSRSMSDLSRQALAMAEVYRKKVGVVTPSAGRSFTVGIERL